jgi:hypothetical protein
VGQQTLHRHCTVLIIVQMMPCTTHSETDLHPQARSRWEPRVNTARIRDLEQPNSKQKGKRNWVARFWESGTANECEEDRVAKLWLSIRHFGLWAEIPSRKHPLCCWPELALLFRWHLFSESTRILQRFVAVCEFRSPWIHRPNSSLQSDCRLGSLLDLGDSIRRDSKLLAS